MRFLNIAVENRVLRPEQIIMGTSGTVHDWIMKKEGWLLLSKVKLN